MTTARIYWLCGFFLACAGMLVALWTLTHPWGELAGAAVGMSAQWMISHTFHFLAGVMGLAGLLGFVDREVHVAGRFERVAFGIAFIGTILFAATGIFTAFVWPVLAANAPELTAINGPFYSPPHPLTVVTRFSYSFGHILFAAALMRSHAMGRTGGIALIVGAVLLMVPTEPISGLPWVIFPVGGILFGAGMMALGKTLHADD